MSIELVRFAATRERPEIRVILALTAAERAAVYALRYDVYVSEMGLLAPDHAFVQGSAVVDPWDERSIQLLALVGDEPVGTMRLTPAAGGPLELEQYCSLAGLSVDRDALAEATRYMVRAAWRRSLVGGALLLATWRVLRLAGLRGLVAAGKLGSLSRYYQAVGLKRVGQGSFTYDLVGSARYELLLLDAGRPASLTRLRLAAMVSVLYVAAVLLGRRDWVFRRGAAPRTDPAKPALGVASR